MSVLADFAKKDMIEQIMLLEEITEKRRVEALPELLNLYANPLADHAVDEMVYYTVYGLLADQDGQIAAALGHPSLRVRLLAIRRAGESVARSALPALFALLETTTSVEVLSEVIRSLGNFREPEIIDRLFPFLEHKDYVVTAWAMKVLTESGEARVRQALMRLITGDQDLLRNECDLRLIMAVENLSSFRDEETARFLTSYLHHSCPAFRKEIISALAAMGAAALPALKECLESGGRDEKIMAANDLGLTGQKKGADILVEYLQNSSELEPNLKFAIYEALGRIPSLRSIVGLIDGLAEENEMVLLAVMTGLDHHCHGGIVKKVAEVLAKGDAQSKRILKALVTARATKLFADLYQAGDHADSLVAALLASGDREAAGIFRKELERMEGERVAADLARLTIEEGAGGMARILAADDSKAMLFFYKGMAAELGIELITAGDGKEALECLQSGVPVDLLITDLNMPNLDGVGLVREIRRQPRWQSLPILMASTESEQNQIELAREAGVSEFISKPFTSAQLRAKIEAIMNIVN